MIFRQRPLLSAGSQTPRIQSHGALRVDRGRGGGQGEEEDPVRCAVLCAHQPGPSASGDGEQPVERLIFDPRKNQFDVSEDSVFALADLFLCLI